MRYLSLFSGIEAATVAWEPLGWEPAAFAEVDAWCRKLLRKRYPSVPNLGDVRDIDWEEFEREYGRVDLIVGGSPCQSFSVAGRMEGMRGESGVLVEYVRAVQALRPRYVVWENVKGALSAENGEAFGWFIRTLDDLGYGVAWRVLDAAMFGLPQHRERVFAVASLGDPRAAEVLFDTAGLRDNYSVSTERYDAAFARLGAENHHCCCIGGDSSHSTVFIEQCPTLTIGGNMARVVTDETVRRLTPVEYERIMGFPDGYTEVMGSDSQRYKALANSMAVPVMRWIGERVEAVEER